jgi:tripartite-type tricarboxylate transporter receptor subunit TctC
LVKISEFGKNTDYICPEAVLRIPKFKIFFGLFLAVFLALWLFFPGRLVRGSDQPERLLSMVAGLPESPGGGFLETLAERLGPKISARIRLTYTPAGGGVLAANRLSLAHPDGSILGVLPMNAVVTKTILERTPYILEDFEPILLAWNVPYVLLAPLDAPYNNLSQLDQASLTQKITFYHDGLDPVSAGTLEALALNSQLNNKWELKEINSVNLELITQSSNPLALMAWPLDSLPKGTPNYKILAVLTDSYHGPCAPDGLDLTAQNLKAAVHDYLGFYYPSKTIQAETSLMAQALASLADDPQIDQAAEKNCLVKSHKSPAQAQSTLQQEYSAQAELLAALYSRGVLGQINP